MENEHFVRDFRQISRKKLPKRAFGARLLANFTEEASKTSISCESSFIFHARSFQNERFVRDFLHFSRQKLPKRAFRARLPKLFTAEASKTSISRKTSASFHRRSFQSIAPATQKANATSDLETLKRQNEHFVRDFRQISCKKLPKRAFRARLPSYKTPSLPRFLTLCHVDAALPVRSMEKARSPRHKMLRLSRKMDTPHRKVLHLPRKNDTLLQTWC